MCLCCVCFRTKTAYELRISDWSSDVCPSDRGVGTGPVAAVVAALQPDLGIELEVVDYSEHSLNAGTYAMAVAYVEASGPDGELRWGVGMHESILTASLRAVISAANRQRAAEHLVIRHEP